MRSILPSEENPILRGVCQEVPPGDISGTRIQSLIADMKKLLAQEKYGVALAAPQVGEPLRIFVVSGAALARGARRAKDEPEKREDAPALPDQVYINPTFVRVSKTKKDKHEGCLSIRGKWGIVPRAEKASIRALDEHGAPFTRGASGFLAHIFQHEMDHLDGVLYTDKAVSFYDDDPAE